MGMDARARVILTTPADMKKRKTKAPVPQADFLAGLLDSTNLVIYLKDLDGRYLYVNRRYEALSGVPRGVIIGKRDHDLFPKEVADLFRAQDGQVAARRAPLEFEETIPLPGGLLSFITEKFPLFDAKGAIYATGGFCTEITAQKKRAEAELFKIRSLESLGFLAGGIAHDFNNLLTGIIGGLDLLSEELPVSGPARELVDDAEKTCAKAAALARQLLTFAEGGAPVLRPVAPGPLLSDAAHLVLHGSKVRAHVEAPGDLWPVEGDDAQLTQILGNLLINAREAMPEGGAVWLHAENHVLAEAMLHLPAGRYVRLTIRDDGPGIPAQALSRVFDPYFSTKKRGSGLGLSIVHSVVRRHGGHVWAESAEGEGAVFTVLLPATDKPVPRERAAPKAPLRKGRGRVLVMDDERAVGDIARRALGRAGYHVSVEREGAAAVEAYRKAMAAGRRFDAVILDLTVHEGMGGAEASARILELDPKARVILSSGYSKEDIGGALKGREGIGVLQKPYSIRQLTKTVADAIWRR